MVECVEEHGNIGGCFRFIETFAVNSEFYQLVAKPLLSICTVESFDVEHRHRIKQLKHTIVTKNVTVLKMQRGLLSSGRLNI